MGGIAGPAERRRTAVAKDRDVCHGDQQTCRREVAHGSPVHHAQSGAAGARARALLCRHGAHPQLRGAGDRAVPGGRGQGHRAQLHRRGGDRGRHLRASARRRLRRELPPRPWPLHRQGRAHRSHDGRADGARDRLLPRARRLDARGRSGAQHPRRERHRRRRHAALGRRRAGDQAPGRRSGGGGVLRRRRQQPGHLPRIPQPRDRVAPAGAVRVREQPLRAQHLVPAQHGDRVGGGARGRLRHSRRAHRRQRRGRGARRDRRSGGAGARGRRPEPDRGADLALGPAQHARQSARPAHRWGDGRLEGARPDRPAAQHAERARDHRGPRAGRDRRRGEAGAGRRRGVRGEQPGARGESARDRGLRAACGVRGAGRARQSRADLRPGAERGDGAGDGARSGACS